MVLRFFFSQRQSGRLLNRQDKERAKKKEEEKARESCYVHFIFHQWIFILQFFHW